nr:MAG TPA: hypothetical protein [Caudoviricetes sp.]
MSHPLWYNGIIGRLWKHSLLIFTARVLTLLHGAG